jgi:hypothetical protein
MDTKKTRKCTQEPDGQTDECMHRLLRKKMSLQQVGGGAYVYMHLSV